METSSTCRRGVQDQDYATHADQLLTPTLAQAWQHILSELLQGIGDANAYASSVCQALAGEPSQEQVSPQLADNIVKEQIKWDWQSPQTIGQAAARIATGLSELR